MVAVAQPLTGARFGPTDQQPSACQGMCNLHGVKFQFIWHSRCVAAVLYHGQQEPDRQSRESPMVIQHCVAAVLYHQLL